MKTEIFKSYADFLKREDKLVNGVSEEFAKTHENYAKMNETNSGCWNCSYCSDCSYCIYCSYCSGCHDCRDCSGCSDCRYCSDCRGCSDCRYCSDCRGCSHCSYCNDCSYCNGCWNCSDCSDCSYLFAGEQLKEPTIENIHSAVLSAATASDDDLDMENWHICNTTHCRAGWVVHLAGEAGYELEKKTSTEFAAMSIYNASSDIKVSPSMFYVNNEESIADMRRCADLEIKNATK